MTVGEMKYAVQDGIKNIVIKNKVIPKIRPGHVLAKTISVGICGSDLHQYRERTSAQTEPDGHEVECRIVEIGEGVEGISVGDNVTIDFIIASTCGSCEFCTSGNPRQCCGKWLPFGGGYSEYILVKSQSVFKLPEDLEVGLGCLVEPLAVGVHAIRMLPNDPFRDILIVGGGMIGLATLATAKYFGFKNVDILVKHNFQKDAAEMLGARHVLRDSGMLEAVQTHTRNGLGYDFTIEAVGGKANSLNMCFKATRPIGKIVVLGAFSPGFRDFEFNDAHLKEVSVLSSNCYGTKDGVADYEVAIDVLNSMKIVLGKLITHKFSLDEISQGFEIANNKAIGQAIKVQILT